MANRMMKQARIANRVRVLDVLSLMNCRNSLILENFSDIDRNFSTLRNLRVAKQMKNSLKRPTMSKMMVS